VTLTNQACPRYGQLNYPAKYLGQRSFCLKVIKHTQTHNYGGYTALSGLQSGW